MIKKTGTGMMGFQIGTPDFAAKPAKTITVRKSKTIGDAITPTRKISALKIIQAKEWLTEDQVDDARKKIKAQTLKDDNVTVDFDFFSIFGK